MNTSDLIFPDKFIWGTATAGHQIEGNNIHSDWWKFEQEGKIKDGTVSGKNIDYWNRYEEDHELMAKLGYKGFRLGIEWSRIEPQEGRFDMDALEHYRKILESLRRHGIQICLTLYHWVLPLWFTESGGWERPDAIARFMRYCELIIKELGEFPDIWVTLNEPTVVPVAGFLAGMYPPEKKSFRAYCHVTATFLRAHAKCYRLIHREAPHAPDGGPAMAGVAYAYQWVEPWGTAGLPGLVEQALSPILAFGSFGHWDRAITTGRIPPPYGINERVPFLKDSVDFCGVNYYTRFSVRCNPGARGDKRLLSVYDVPEGTEENQMGWQCYPPGFYLTLKRIHALYGKPVYITENGVAEPTDSMRPRYLLEHLSQLHRSIRDGVDVRGYFYWSYIDNFEWKEGFTKKLGLVECDYADPALERRPRRTAYLYSDISAKNGVTREMVEKYAPEAMEGVFGEKWLRTE